jgi:hypothetical protein
LPISFPGISKIRGIRGVFKVFKEKRPAALVVVESLGGMAGFAAAAGIFDLYCFFKAHFISQNL